MANSLFLVSVWLNNFGNPSTRQFINPAASVCCKKAPKKGL
jgi:hypothetical protein